MDAVINKLENILKSAYDIKNYMDLVKEIFPKASLKEVNVKKEISNFSSHIETYTQVGYFNTPDKKSIVIMAAKLKNESYVENSRSIQRNYAKMMMERAGSDAAFIAFYTDGKPKWRLSLVRLDYEMKIKNGRLKAIESLTPAKRYSYLVGEEEPCHTAVSRFERFIIGNMADPNYPTLDALEEIFSVEKVTDEFFRLYCEKFHQLRESLENNEDFRNEAERHNFTSAQFSKKLMGQIVFLYFLQKKGWLGVKVWPEILTEKEYKNALYVNKAPSAIKQRAQKIIPNIYSWSDDGKYKLNNERLDIADGEEALVGWSVIGEPWGNGPHNFMRELFNIAERKNQNFFDELLEPLFYNTLNVNRGEEGYCSKLHCRMPFISGGLFEPIDNYDWRYNKFNVPNDIFSNVSTKGREADGILDIFDRYNFTMSEDEPMEREVAIDPEMLGKVFENLLEINDRKSKGAFYTPREIVHYMCQESLINYLTDALKVDEESIREFILYGDFIKSEDTVKEKRQGNASMYISESLFKVDGDGRVVTNRLKDIDEALKRVRIADPAVGSGAFPVGMLNEIVRTRQNISAYMAINMEKRHIKDMYKSERSPYKLKYETIKNCIFAVDIEPSAVDIACLRLWLSLVIDDEINPNAQYEITDGKRIEVDGHREPSPLPNLECNILCGNSLIDEFEGIRLIKESEIFGDKWNQLDISQTRFEDALEELIEKQNELFRCKDTKNKEELKKEIEVLKDRVIMPQMELCDAERVERYMGSRKLASKPYVLWQLDFARVFREKGGFDIVIGNPPYIDSENMVNQGLEEERNYLAKRFKFTRGNWDIYIAFFEKGYNLLNKKGALAYITPDKWISKPFGKEMRKNLINNFKSILVAGREVFESALVDSIITIITKQECDRIEYLRLNEDSRKIEHIQWVDKAILSEPYALDIIFSDSIEIISKLETTFEQLSNFYKCENACSTSDCYKLKEILFSLETLEQYDANKHYKVINTGTIGRYTARWGKQPMKYLKDKYNYPVVNKKEFQELFPNSYGQKGEKKKIIIKGLTLLDASIDYEGEIIPGKSTMMIECEKYDDLLYLAGIINSKLMIYYIKQKYSSSSYNGGINFTKDMINSLPWRSSDGDFQTIVHLVEKAKDIDVENNKEELLCIDKKINQVVYRIYALTPEEVKIVENSI